ncbi:MAG: DUF2298 domain-containing protein [Chloroflexi bacterium]|nr:DUF2298 domain-containing protein [Chloroflexota bacterium]MCY4248421.1 DUF2298 domain-containing protein [Chloroflexota bacterium]
MTPMPAHSETRIRQFSPLRRGNVIGLLLALVLAYGLGLRLVGQNWDDYSHTHPDELFLTLLALPHFGGENNFTPDPVNFPRQQIITHSQTSTIRTHRDILGAASLRLGAVAGTFAAEAAHWLANGAPVASYLDMTAAQHALRARQVDVVLAQATASLASDAEIVFGNAIESAELQWLYCRFHNPASDGVGGYFDTRCSPLNPHNATQSFFVYGTLPIFLAHFGSEILRAGTEASLPFFDFLTQHLVWRGISMVFDSLSILVVFLLGRRVHDSWVGLLAALFYASSPLAIQLAHFGTVNAIACFWVCLALYFAVGAQQRGRRGAYWWFGIACGAAVASRINLAPLAGVIVLAAAVQMLPALSPQLGGRLRQQLVLRAVTGLFLAGFGAFLAFRLFNPYAFAGPGFLNILPNDRWLENIQRISVTVSSPQEFPPNWQWLARSSIVHPAKDMLFWGMGITFGILGWFGWGWSAQRILRLGAGSTRQLLLVVWVGGYTIWMARLFVLTLRYYLPLYGALAVLAGWCLVELWRRAQCAERSPPIAAGLLLFFGLFFAGVGAAHALGVAADATAITAIGLGLVLLAAAIAPGFHRGRVLVLGGFALGFALTWGLMSAGRYQRQTTLVRGSRYLFEQVPGDFAMRIAGADSSAPLINIAFHNSGVPLPGFEEAAYRGANHYVENQAKRQAFVAPASGTISSVHAPHLFDPHDDDQPEHLGLRVYAADGITLLAEATLYANLPRDKHALGAAYDIPFANPAKVSAGETYHFEALALPGSGDVVGSGSVVLVEGDWDNRVTGINTCGLPQGTRLADDLPAGSFRPDECRGTQAWYGLVNSVDQIMSYPVDDQIKKEDILRSLELGDYLTIASNRFYDHLRRNLKRWPLSTLYYEKLFAGELGYELELALDEPFAWGPWRVSDQHLPTYASPVWLNEIEADEAYHVYDHPAVFIFRKTEAYSQARVEAMFSQVSLLQYHELRPEAEQAQDLGLLYWNLTEAERAPTALMFPPEELAAQSAGGTWSERFFSDSIANTNQVVGAAVWYAAIFLIGALVFPLVHSIFPNMADGGYGVSKLVGLLMIAWLAWAVSSLKIPLWSQAGLLFSLLLVALFSGVVGFRNRRRLAGFLSEHWRRLAWMEMLSIAAFLLMIGIRLTNPDLWHPYKGGEKPMDFAFLNGVLRSTTFPPIDPWFAGGFINYYYFGYVLLGAPTLLLGIVPAFAYNLMIPTIFCLTGMGAFSAAFNIADRLRRHDGKGSATVSRRCGSAWVAGVMALLLCVVLGNLDTARVFGHGIARLGGYSRPEGLESFLVDEYLAENEFTLSDQARQELAARASAGMIGDSLRYELNNSAQLLGSIMRGLSRALGGEPLPIGSDRWYWGPSRILAETPGVGGGAITEMPFFTFVYGDLHAHMINMPLILLTALCLFNEITQVGRERRGWQERWLALALLALTVGLMQATNTWDYPSMLLLALAGLAYAWHQRWTPTLRLVSDARSWTMPLGVAALAVVLLSLIATDDRGYLFGSSPQLAVVAGAARTGLLLCMGLVGGWLGLRSWLTRASALDLAATLGGFALLCWAVALPYTSWYAASYGSIALWQGGKTPLWAYLDIHGFFLFLLVSLLIWDTAHWLRSARVQSLQASWRQLRWAVAGSVAILLLAVALTLAHVQVALIALPLVCWIVWLFFRPGQSPALRFTLVLAGLALALTLGVEIIVIGGDIGRQNTVFKFYIQVWLLLSVAGGVAFACLLKSREQFSRGLRWLWTLPCLGLFVVAGLFPVMATRGRSFDRMVPDTPLTLNGLDYMRRAELVQFTATGGEPRSIPLGADLALIRWLQEHVAGSPVIMEGRRFPSEYQYNGRISIATGLPSVLGWNFHQRQQRTFFPMHQMINQRDANVRQFYNTSSIDIAVDLLHVYAVKYIIVSDYEAAQASPEGLEKFQRMVDRGLLTVVFAVDGGAIYKVQEAALLDYLVDRYR